MNNEQKLVVDGLKYCAAHELCEGCPAKDTCYPRDDMLIGLAVDMIVQMAADLEWLKRERDAAMRDVKSLCATNYFSGNFCAYCKYNEPDGQCHHDCVPYSADWGWEWRGPCAENGGNT